MTAKTHILGGIAAGIALSILQQRTLNSLSAVTLAVSTLGALFPDIDNRRSKMGNRAKITSNVIQRVIGHRTLFHSPVLYVVVHCLLLLFLPAGLARYVPAFSAGIGSHLLLDMFNQKGIPLLYPYRKRFHLMSIRSGSFLEFLFACLLLAGVVLMGIYWLQI